MTATSTVHVKYTWDDRDMRAELDDLTLDELAEKKIRGAIRTEMNKARREISKDARAALPNDPRGAYKAVKRVVYKKGLGGNVSLLNGKRGKSMAIYSNPDRGGRSGIIRHRKVSYRTKQINGYEGAQRAFILRFVEEGTMSRYAKTVKYAHRGSLTGRPFFASSSKRAIEGASERLNDRLEKMIVKAQRTKRGLQ